MKRSTATDIPAWSELRAAWSPAVPALDEDAILRAVLDEAAVRPVRGAPRRPATPWLGAAAVAASLALSAFTFANAGGSADRQIGLAWAHGIEPQTIETSVMLAARAPSPVFDLYDAPDFAPATPNQEIAP